MDASQLIAVVEQTAPSATALERIATAVRVGDQASNAADDTVRHFVEAARRAGHSWSEIGAQLGVSRQAARQRFVDAEAMFAQPPELERRPRLQSCIAAAAHEAESDGSPETGSQHLLLGLFAEGYAANLLDRFGVTLERARAEVQLLFPGPAASDPDDPLTAATRFALECGHDYVGTEHLLFVLALDPGSRANRVLEHLGVAAAIRQECKRCFEPGRGTHWKRRRPRSGQCRCSFCGRRQDQACLVAGPGVWICQRCVGLATDILRTESAAAP